MAVINDDEFLAMLINGIANNHPTSGDDAKDLAEKLAPYLVECMWSEYDKVLAEELYKTNEDG